MSEEKRYCKYCKSTRALAPIGKDRKNGKGSHSDWESREFHKQCYKKIMNLKPSDRLALFIFLSRKNSSYLKTKLLYILNNIYIMVSKQELLEKFEKLRAYRQKANKLYYERHRKKTSPERFVGIVKCECGKEYHTSKAKQHFATKFHQNFSKDEMSLNIEEAEN